MSFIWNYFQNNRIRNVSQSTENVSSRTLELETNLRATQEKLHQLNTFSIAVSELLQDCGISEDRLNEKLVEVNKRIRDSNNKFEQIRACSECLRAAAPHHKKCFYCGSKLDG